MNAIKILKREHQKRNWRKQLEVELRDLLANATEDDVVSFVLEKTLKSFNNGLRTGALKAMNGDKAKRSR